jgi:hypothetical protein
MKIEFIASEVLDITDDSLNDNIRRGQSDDI